MNPNPAKTNRMKLAVAILLHVLVNKEDCMHRGHSHMKTTLASHGLI